MAMGLNPNECKTVSFHRRKNPLIFSYRIACAILEWVLSYKYLEITLCSDIAWTTHITNIISSANKTLGFLKLHLHHASQNVKLLAISLSWGWNWNIHPPFGTFINNMSSINSSHFKIKLQGLCPLSTRMMSANQHWNQNPVYHHSHLVAELLAFVFFTRFFYSSLGKSLYILPPTRISIAPVTHNKLLGQVPAASLFRLDFFSVQEQTETAFPMT